VSYPDNVVVATPSTVNARVGVIVPSVVLKATGIPSGKQFDENIALTVAASFSGTSLKRDTVSHGSPVIVPLKITENKSLKLGSFVPHQLLVAVTVASAVTAEPAGAVLSAKRQQLMIPLPAYIAPPKKFVALFPINVQPVTFNPATAKTPPAFVALLPTNVQSTAFKLPSAKTTPPIPSTYPFLTSKFFIMAVQSG